MGVYPKNISYYKLAFTQKSLHLIVDNSELSNERLEYLGDAVLGAVVADYLYQLFPKEKEGFLSQTRSKIVKRESLNALALNLGFEQFINKTNMSKDVLGNTFEAFVGALYLDKGYEKTKKILIRRIIRNYYNIEELLVFDDDYKSRIINYAQKNHIKIDFETIENEEDITGISYITTIILDNKKIGNGSGNSKKISAKNAAKNIIEKLEKKGVEL